MRGIKSTYYRAVFVAVKVVTA